jgi:glycosyltransferase involved in cell wall biosynthesis
MRVLFAVHGFPPRQRAGTECYAEALAGALLRAGDEVAVLARDFDPERPELEVRRERIDGIDRVLVNNGFRSCRSLQDTYRNNAIRRLAGGLLAEWRPDVVHIHHLSGLSTDLVFELERRRIPSLFTLNDFWTICQRGQLLDLELRRCAGPSPAGCGRCLHTDIESASRRLAHVREVLASVDLLLAPSRSLRRRFIEFGIDETKLRLQSQGIDLRPFGERPPAPERPLRVAFAGSLMVSKAPHLLLEAARGLPPEAFRVVLAGGFSPYHGDDSYRTVLDGAAADSPAVAVGPLDRRAVVSLLLATDVLVVPSIWIENAPFVIKEAWAAGSVVVASDLGGMAELVRHEETGLLFAPGDAESLRRTLLRLEREPGLLDRLRRGIPVVKSIDDDAQETRATYDELVTGVAKGRAGFATAGGTKRLHAPADRSLQ